VLKGMITDQGTGIRDRRSGEAVGWRFFKIIRQYPDTEKVIA